MKKLVNIIIEILFKYSYSNSEKKFVEINKKYWLRTKSRSIGILVEGFINSPTNLIEKARIAKAIEEKYDLASLVILRGLFRYSNSAYKIYRSFNIDHYYFWWRDYVNLLLIFKIFINTLILFIKDGDGNSLLKLRFGNILVGDLIYDSIIRTDGNEYTIQKLSIKKHFRHIFRAYYNYYNSLKLLNKNNYKYLVVSHKVYIEYGILVRVAHKKGVTILLKDMEVFKIYTPDYNIREHHLKISKNLLNEAMKNKTTIEEAEKYLSDRMSGKIDEVDVKNAYHNKKEYSKEQLLNALSINVEKYKKIVFIVPHAFTDASHCTEKLLYRDYYIWLENTLRILSNNDSTVCFIKPHPSSYMWNENGIVEDLLERMNIKNIYVVPNDFNTISIKDIADVVVTAQGTAGLEFSCFGIPAVIAGAAYYSGFNIAVESNNVKNYQSKLSNIHKIEPLDEQAKTRAKVVLYLSFKHKIHTRVLPKYQIRPGDNYQQEIKKKYTEVVTNIKHGETLRDTFFHHVKELV